MNAAQPLPHDYRSQMQRLALTYVLEHQAEHLADPTQLAERTTCHLVHQYDVPQYLAPHLVALAISELQPNPCTWLGYDPAIGPDVTVYPLT